MPIVHHVSCCTIRLPEIEVVTENFSLEAGAEVFDSGLFNNLLNPTWTTNRKWSAFVSLCRRRFN